MAKDKKDPFDGKYIGNIWGWRFSITGAIVLLLLLTCAAVGRAAFITPDMVREGAVVIDVGINRVEDASRERGYRLVGDVDFDAVKAKASWITPVPGGVCLMTRAMLLKNTLRAARQSVPA